MGTTSAVGPTTDSFSADDLLASTSRSGIESAIESAIDTSADSSAEAVARWAEPSTERSYTSGIRVRSGSPSRAP